MWGQLGEGGDKAWEYSLPEPYIVQYKPFLTIPMHTVTKP